MEADISECLASVLVSIEEMRRNSEVIDPIDLEEIFVKLDELHRLTEDAADKTSQDLYSHAVLKLKSTLPHILVIFEKDEPPEIEIRQNWQAALARIAELLLLQRHFADQQDQIVNAYVNSQRKAIRDRAKSHLASLVQAREAHFAYETEENISHVSTLSNILGDAASLMHPLLMWKQGLPEEVPLFAMIDKSIQVLDEQAQKLTSRIIEWFNEDRKIQSWLERESQLNLEQLSQLDKIVDELAFLCQLLTQYISLYDSKGDISSTLAQESTWKYASLERLLAVKQYENALTVACPIQIVIDSQIYVPSVIEDATFLSTRSIERAANTKAIGTVAHAVAFEIWERVLEALHHKTGCFRETIAENAPKSESVFASALVDALDEDLKSPTSPPHSGILSSILSTADLMNTEFCLLNGIHAAANSCRSMVAFLDATLEEDHYDEQVSKMTALAREELFRYAKMYDDMLETEVEDAVVTYCGRGEQHGKKTLDTLKRFFENEDFNLDGQKIIAAEAEERLEKLIVQPLKENDFLQEMKGKCEQEVLFQVGRKLVSQIVELVLSSLWTKSCCMNEWGSLLLSKEVRKLQSFIADTLSPEGRNTTMNLSAMSSMEAWERLSQVITIVQLEKPADWLAYQATSVLDMEQTQKTMSLRVDFSPDAIAAVVKR